MEAFFIILVLLTMILPVVGCLLMLKEDNFGNNKLGPKSKIVFSIEIVALILLTALCIV